ncbi:MAG TPA: hypothetical protein VIR00_06615, partial [Micromonosporaceae bacterium]
PPLPSFGSSESVDLDEPGIGVLDPSSCGLPRAGVDAGGPLVTVDVPLVGGLGGDEHPAAHTAAAIAAVTPVTRRRRTTASPGAM